MSLTRPDRSVWCMARDTSTTTLIVAHGSRNPLAVEAHESLCAAVSARVAALALEDHSTTDDRQHRVRPAYLEINEPSIGDAIDVAIAQGAGSVRVVPHFLSPGNHVSVDIPRIVESARTRHPHVIIEVTDHSGVDPAMVDLLADRVLS